MKKSMLKVGKVYLFKKKLPLYVKSKVVRKGVRFYELCKINKNGTLGMSTVRKYKASEFTPSKNIKVIVTIQMPKRHKNVDEFKRILKDIQHYDRLIQGGDLNSSRHRIQIGQLAWAAISLYNVKAGRNYNLRDIGKALKLERNRTLYSRVYKALIKRCNLDKETVRSLSDRYLVEVVQNSSRFYKSIVGYHNELDTAFSGYYKLALKEFRKRGLTLAGNDI
jgi:hypothetical protein